MSPELLLGKRRSRNGRRVNTEYLDECAVECLSDVHDTETTLRIVEPVKSRFPKTNWAKADLMNPSPLALSELRNGEFTRVQVRGRVRMLDSCRQPQCRAMPLRVAGTRQRPSRHPRPLPPVVSEVELSSEGVRSE